MAGVQKAKKEQGGECIGGKRGSPRYYGPDRSKNSSLLENTGRVLKQLRGRKRKKIAMFGLGGGKRGRNGKKVWARKSKSTGLREMEKKHRGDGKEGRNQ